MCAAELAVPRMRKRKIDDSEENADDRSHRVAYEEIGTRSVNGYWQVDLGFHVACPLHRCGDVNLDRCTLGFAKIRLSARKEGRKEERKKGRKEEKRVKVWQFRIKTIKRTTIMWKNKVIK